MRIRTLVSALSLAVVLIGASSVAYANQLQLEPVSAHINWQTAVWQHVPLNITLPVGRQRIIRVPHKAKIGIPPNVANKLISQRFDGWLYLTATQPFGKTSIEIQDSVTGKVILINLAADDKAPDSAINIVYPGMLSNDRAQAGKSRKPNALQGSMAFKTLTQYAEQQLYSPKRLLSNPNHIQLIKSYPDKAGNVPQDEWIYSLFTDKSVVGMPWAEYHGGNYYVTAVVIKNLLPVKLNLTHNLVNLCGRMNGTWQFVDFFPYQKGHMWSLAPRGDRFDSTVAFLVSAQPFNQAIKSCQGDL